MKQDDQEIIDAKKKFENELNSLKKDYDELITRFKLSVSKNKINELWKSEE